jgi:hypothetical protein
MSTEKDLILGIGVTAGIAFPALFGFALGSYYLSRKSVTIQPSQIFSLSPPTGSSFPVNVRLIDHSVVPVAGCFSEMKVSELMKRTAVALQTPPGRVQLQIDGYPIYGDLTLGEAGIGPATLLDFRTSLQEIHPMEEEILKNYTQLLNGEAITITRSQIWAWEGALRPHFLRISNDYPPQMLELFYKTFSK